MRNFKVALFWVVLCCLVKLDETREIPNPSAASEKDAIEEEIPPEEILRTLENSGWNPEIDESGEKLLENLVRLDMRFEQAEEQGETKFPSRVRWEKIQTEYSECGLDMDSFKFGNESTNSTRVWPWMAALSYKEGHLSKLETVCGGSIIGEKLILTSSMCVMNYNGNKRDPNEFLVTLGLPEGKGGNQAQRLEVLAIYVHPDFDQRTNDYNIAVLELKEPITYNRYIRPICLPTGIPENSNLYKPESLGLALGWGIESYDQDLSKRNKDALKEVDLVIQHPRDCKKFLEGLNPELVAYFTDRTFCAAERNHYLCSGDSGGPVMQSRVREDGYRIWTQVGIIGFGVQCGPIYENEYGIGFHTYVQKLMPWILSIAKNTNEME